MEFQGAALYKASQLVKSLENFENHSSEVAIRYKDMEKTLKIARYNYRKYFLFPASCSKWELVKSFTSYMRIIDALLQLRYIGVEFACIYNTNIADRYHVKKVVDLSDWGAHSAYLNPVQAEVINRFSKKADKLEGWWV